MKIQIFGRLTQIISWILLWWLDGAWCAFMVNLIIYQQNLNSSCLCFCQEPSDPAPVCILLLSHLMSSVDYKTSILHVHGRTRDRTHTTILIRIQHSKSPVPLNNSTVIHCVLDTLLLLLHIMEIEIWDTYYRRTIIVVE